MWEVIKLPCGHEIEQSKRWCSSCMRHVAKIKYGEPGRCPYCDKSYRKDRYGFYIEPRL